MYSQKSEKVKKEKLGKVEGRKCNLQLMSYSLNYVTSAKMTIENFCMAPIKETRIMTRVQCSVATAQADSLYMRD